MPITITVDITTGNITVDPTLAYFGINNTVMWQTNGLSLTISFPNQSPFSDFQLRSETNTLEATIVGPKGVYHYNVATVGSDGKIYAIPGCPEIIVQ